MVIYNPVSLSRFRRGARGRVARRGIPSPPTPTARAWLRKVALLCGRRPYDGDVAWGGGCDDSAASPLSSSSPHPLMPPFTSPDETAPVIRPLGQDAGLTSPVERREPRGRRSRWRSHRPSRPGPQSAAARLCPLPGPFIPEHCPSFTNPTARRGH